MVIFEIQSRMIHRQRLHLRKELGGTVVGLLFYSFVYSLIMQPICVWGYFAEFFNQRRNWETK